MFVKWLKIIDKAFGNWCLSRCHNISDLRRFAKLRVPLPMFHYLDGASDDEVTMERNEKDFGRYDFLPRYLIDVSSIDTSTTVMGSTIDFPVVCAPTGMSRLFHNDGELAVSRAAAAAGTIYSLSTVSTYSIEEVAEVCVGPKWFQLYVFRDRNLVSELLERSREAGYTGLVLTVDVPVAGNRERDLRTGMAMPPKLTFVSWFSFLLRPLWSLKYLVSEAFQLANVKHKAPVGEQGATSLVEYLNRQFDMTVDWSAAEAIGKEWDGPFAIKGISSVEDAIKAADIGASAVILSNHGGRQLDFAASPISILPDVAEAVGSRLEIILDGGVRRGTDVIKALALGATACMIGRPYLFGLGVSGETGVAKALTILRTEVERCMGLLGCCSIKEISKEFLNERR